MLMWSDRASRNRTFEESRRLSCGARGEDRRSDVRFRPAAPGLIYRTAPPAESGKRRRNVENVSAAAAAAVNEALPAGGRME